MGLVAKIAQATGIASQRIGSLELIPFDDAQRFLEAVAGRNLAVLGIEGFRIAAEQAIPDMRAIADFSAPIGDGQATARSIADASQFIREVGDETMFFDFLLEETQREGSVGLDGNA